jgi:MipA family protein
MVFRWSALAMSAAVGWACHAHAQATMPPPATEAPAQAQPEAPSPSPSPAPPKTPSPWWGFALGSTIEQAPPYPGAGFERLTMRPVAMLKMGRWRLSTSRGAGLYGFANESAGAGASTELLDAGRWRLGLSFRYDSGRKASESPQLAGLPDVERTLRGRLYASYELTKRWSVNASLSHDLLGRGGGALARGGLAFRQPFVWADRPWEWSANAGTGWADRTHLQTRYGITAEQSVATGLRAFDPRASLLDVGVNASLTTALTPNWVAFTTLGNSRLVGDAAQSPLTVQAGQTRWALGLVYRCCR